MQRKLQEDYDPCLEGVPEYVLRLTAYSKIAAELGLDIDPQQIVHRLARAEFIEYVQWFDPENVVPQLQELLQDILAAGPEIGTDVIRIMRRELMPC